MKIYLGNKGDTELELAEDNVIQMRPLAKCTGGLFDIKGRKAFRVETWDGFVKTQKYVYYKMDTRYDTCMKFATFEEAKLAAEEYYREKNKVWKDTLFDVKAKDLTPHIMDNYRFVQPSVEYEEQEVPLDPYFLGMWLGDGTSLSTEITNIDKEVIEYIDKIANLYHVQVIRGKSGISYRFRGDGTHGGNHVMARLRQLNLIGNKHIPECYLHNSKSVRLAVLAGVIDTDGYLARNSYEIVQKSKKLAKDIVALAMSLCIYSERRPKIGWAANTVLKVKREYNRMYLHIPSTDLAPPVLIPRKVWSEPMIDFGIRVSMIANNDFHQVWPHEQKIELFRLVSNYIDKNGRVPWKTIVEAEPQYAKFAPDSLRANYNRFLREFEDV